MRPWIDYQPGDLVTVVVNGEERSSRVTGIGLALGSQGLLCGLTLGDPLRWQDDQPTTY
jgi:hypothetical protein